MSSLAGVWFCAFQRWLYCSSHTDSFPVIMSASNEETSTRIAVFQRKEVRRTLHNNE